MLGGKIGRAGAEVPFCAGDRAVSCPDLSRFVQIYLDAAQFGQVFARNNPDMCRSVQVGVGVWTLSAGGGIESGRGSLAQRFEDLVEADDAEQASTLNHGQDEGAFLLQALEGLVGAGVWF